MKNTEAIIHFNNKALLTSQSYLDVKAYEHALAFTVAKMLDEDLLKNTRDLIAKSLENGTSFHDFKQQLKPLLSKDGWGNMTDDESELNRRLRTIYHTNLHSAYSAGQWERVQKTKEFLPFLQYMPSLSENQRLAHKRYYNLVRAVDDPIWQSIFPPNSYGCKCWVKQLTKTTAQKILDEQAKQGIAHDLQTEEVQNPKTGEIMTVPKGVHFSFNHNHDRLTALLKLAEDKHDTKFGEKLRKQLLSEVLTVFSQSMSANEFVQAMNNSIYNRRAKSLLSKNPSIIQQAEQLGLSYEELFALTGYTDSHGGVQNFLRDFEKFMQSHKYYARMTAKQIQYMIQGLHKLPNYVGEVVRRVNRYHHLKNLKVGDVVVERGFASSSMIGANPKDDTFSNYNARLIIQSKTGKRIDWLAYYPHQREVIFAPNAHFQVTQIQQQGGELWINLTEIL